MSRSLLLAFLLTCLWHLGGCVERRETITISPRGKVIIELLYRTDQQNELPPGRLLADDGWKWQASVERDAAGRESKYTLNATKQFAVNAELPSADPGDREGKDAALQFPTSVVFERRTDGAVCHFHRVFTARRWAYIAATRDQMLGGEIKEIIAKDPKLMTEDERIKVAQAIAQFELTKQTAFARDAFDEVWPASETPQDLWLRLRGGMLNVQNTMDIPAIAALLASGEDVLRDALLKSEAAKFQDALEQAMQVVLRDQCGFADGDIAHFMQRYHWHQRYFAATERLDSQSFEITVVMPGPIAGSNADVVSGNAATWRFGGAMIRDRSVELMASSTAR